MTTPGETAKLPAIPMAATIVLVGVLASIYVLSQFFRNSIGVIAPDLAAELQLSASEIGLLSSTFFFAFAAAQIPLGISIDRYGPKTCMLVCAAVTIGGAVLFAFAKSPAGLIAARVLMGAGSSCYLMAPLALYARRYPADRFATLVGIQLGLGSIGTLLATAPLAFAAAAIGWRQTFVVAAILMGLIAAVVAAAVHDDHRGGASQAHRESLREGIGGLVEVLRMPSVVRLFLMHITAYSSFVLVVGLWGGPYLTHIYGYGLSARGEILLVAAITQIAGALLWGPADRWLGGYKLPVFLGAGLTALCLAIVAALGVLPVAGLLVWFAVIGAASAYTPVLIAHGKALFPPRLVGRGITLLNIGTMGGVFLSQTISGFVIDLFPVREGAYALDAYRWVFGLQAAFVLAACLAYIGARDPRAHS